MVFHTMQKCQNQLIILIILSLHYKPNGTFARGFNTRYTI